MPAPLVRLLPSFYLSRFLVALASKRQLHQLRLGQFAVRNDGLQMLFHLADDIDRKEQLLSPELVFNAGSFPSLDILGFQIVEGFFNEFVIEDTFGL